MNKFIGDKIGHLKMQHLRVYVHTCEESKKLEIPLNWDKMRNLLELNLNYDFTPLQGNKNHTIKRIQNFISLFFSPPPSSQQPNISGKNSKK